MSILIRGMEMPETCGLCKLCLDDSRICNGYCMFFHRRVNMMERDKNCPLVPLPEGHGDLVERKELNLFPDYKDVQNRIEQTIKATERDGRNITGVTIDLLKQTLVALDSLHSVRRYFLNAKTIVPAEGGKADDN